MSSTKRSNILKTNKLATASLVFGLLAVIFMWVPVVGIASLILGIASLVLSVMAKRRPEGYGFRNAGFIMGVVSTTFGAVQLIAVLFFAQLIFGAMGSIGNLGSNSTEETYSAPQYVEQTETQDVPMDTDFAPETAVDSDKLTSYLSASPMSEKGISIILSEEGYTDFEISDMIKSSGVDFREQAKRSAEEVASMNPGITYDGLVSSLDSLGYTSEQSIVGANSVSP